MIRIYKQGTAGWVDISDHVIEVSGIERRFNFDWSPVAATPTIRTFGIEVVKGDVLDIRIDEFSILRVDVESTEFSFEKGTIEAKCTDVIARLSEIYAYNVSTLWWSGQGATLAEYKFVQGEIGYWDEQYVSALYLVRHMIRYNTGVDCDVSSVWAEPSGFFWWQGVAGNHYTQRSMTYGQVGVNLRQVRYIGATEPDFKWFDTATCFDLMTEILTTMGLALTYYNGTFVVVRPAVFQVNDDTVIGKSVTETEPFVVVKTTQKNVPLAAIYDHFFHQAAWENDDVIETVSEYPEAYEGPLRGKNLDILNNYIPYVIETAYQVYRLRSFRPSGTTFPSYFTQFVLRIAPRWIEPMQTTRMTIPIVLIAPAEGLPMATKYNAKAGTMEITL